MRPRRTCRDVCPRQNASSARRRFLPAFGASGPSGAQRPRRAASVKRLRAEANAAIDGAGVHVDAPDLADVAPGRQLAERAAADVDVILATFGAPVGVVRVVVR